jgi:Tfp pilus assembly protein PilZ
MDAQEQKITEPQDRRNMPRWEFSKPLFCNFETKQEVYQGLTRDLSYSGVGFQVNKNLELDQDVYLAVKLSDEDTVYLHGKVIWAHKAPDGNKAGLHLTAVDDIARDLIYKHSFRLHRKEFIDNFFRGWADSD